MNFTVEPQVWGHSLCPLEVVFNAMVRGPGGVSFVGRLSISRRVLSWKFH